MMRAKNTAHESIFKFHWKKMWPFSLIWPQVDFIRIVRLMGELQKNVTSQKALVKEAKSKAKPYEKTFLDTCLLTWTALANLANILPQSPSGSRTCLKRSSTTT